MRTPILPALLLSVFLAPALQAQVPVEASGRRGNAQLTEVLEQLRAQLEAIEASSRDLRAQIEAMSAPGRRGGGRRGGGQRRGRGGFGRRGGQVGPGQSTRTYRLMEEVDIKGVLVNPANYLPKNRYTGR